MQAIKTKLNQIIKNIIAYKSKRIFILTIVLESESSTVPRINGIIDFFAVELR